MKPLLTVVTVTFNAGDGLSKTLASVTAQSARERIEYLVQDGASTDGTLAVVQQAAARGELDAWHSEPDQGIYDAMNKAVLRARGTYVLFLNAGDVFPQVDTLERFLDWGPTWPDFVWGDSQVDQNGIVVPDPASRMLRFLYRQMTVSHQSLAVRTTLLRDHRFDLQYRVAADYDVLCHLVTSGHSGLYRPLVVSQTLDEGFSSRNFWLGLDEKRRISRQYFPGDQWRARPYFWLWGAYMKRKLSLQEKP